MGTTNIANTYLARSGRCQITYWQEADALVSCYGALPSVCRGLYGFISFVLRQCFSSTAEGVYLERRASEYGIYRNKASKAVGTVTFEGTGTVLEGTYQQMVTKVPSHRMLFF